MLKPTPDKQGKTYPRDQLKFRIPMQNSDQIPTVKI